MYVYISVRDRCGGFWGAIIYIYIYIFLFFLYTYTYCDSFAMWATDIVVSQITIACYRNV